MKTAHSLPILALEVTTALVQLPASTQIAIDHAARKALAGTVCTSASIAVVKDGKVAYVQAYGDAQLDPMQQSTLRYLLLAFPVFARVAHPLRNGIEVAIVVCAFTAFHPILLVSCWNWSPVVRCRGQALPVNAAAPASRA